MQVKSFLVNMDDNVDANITTDESTRELEMKCVTRLSSSCLMALCDRYIIDKSNRPDSLHNKFTW